MSLKFKRRIEDFVCEHCGEEVKGDGYTNHCQLCLWSRHVDIFPGDRAEDCGGLMEPVASEESGGEWSLIHKCQKCGQSRRNKISKQDNFEEVIKVGAK